MKKVIAAVSALTYFADLIYCLYSLVQFGIVKNFALLWICPFLIQFVCYLVILFKKFFSHKLAVFVTSFGFVLSLPIFLLSLPEIIGWNLAIIAVSILSLMFFIKRK